jgi:thiol-disulfide isomerase/thioredoxin
MGVFGLLICAGALFGADPNSAEPNGMVLNFSSTRCGPCQQMSPLITQMSREGLPIRKVDIDREPDLARHYGVTSIPAFVLVVDGREVSRLIGRQDETVLRQLVARIPSKQKVRVPDLPGAAGLLTVGAGGADGEIRSAPRGGPGASAPAFQSKRTRERAGSGEVRTASVDPGESPQPARRDVSDFVGSGPADGVLVADAPIPELSPAALDASGKPVKTPFRNPFAGGKPKAASRPAVVRGQTRDSDLEPVASSPMASTVRIRVSDGKSENFGTGTIVDSRVGRSVIVTCGHIFRDITNKHRIVVETFADGSDEPLASYVGKVLKYDLESDCGVLTIPAEGLSVTRVADTTFALLKGLPVRSIGCGGGDRPTAHTMRITAENRYLGPHNIECDDLPVQGRSGGGLFSKDGQLIGVCTAADTKEQRGIYCGLKAVHKLLDDCQMSWLYRGETPGDVVLADAGDTPAADEAPLAEEAVGDAALAEALADAGEAEVVCVIRPIDRPRDSTRVVVINRASPKFLGYLSDEVDSQADVRQTGLTQRAPRPAPLATATVPAEFVTDEPVIDEETDSAPRATSRRAPELLAGEGAESRAKPYRRARSGVE